MLFLNILYSGRKMKFDSIFNFYKIYKLIIYSFIKNNFRKGY